MPCPRHATDRRMRKLHRHSALVIIALLLAAFALATPAPAHAATLAVTSCSGNATTAGSLPAVLATAGANDTISFAQDCTGTNTITLTATLVLPVNVTIDATMPPHTIVVDGGSTSTAFYTGVGVFAVNTDVQATFRGLTIQHGKGGGGGAIFNLGTVVVEGCTFSGNISNAGTGGGAIDNRGTLTVVNSTFFGNTAGNRADNNAGGGAIANNGTLTIVGSTFAGNLAGGSGFGGAIENGGTLRLALSVMAGNRSIRGTDIFGSVTTDGGGNVVDDTTFSSGLIAPSDKLNVPALLAPPGNYGGTVQTVALLPGSPAIDIAACPIDPATGVTLATDARDVPRPQGMGGLCDAGSYESRGFLIGSLSGNNQSAVARIAFASPVGLIVSSTNSEPVSGGQATFTIIAGTGGTSATFSATSGCTLSTMNTVAVCAIGAGGNATSPNFTANGTVGTFTVVATANGATPITFTETVTAPTLTTLTTTAPAANGGMMPTLRPGGTLPLTTTGTYNNGTTGPVTGLMYTSSNPNSATVNATTGVVTALTGGQTTITVTAPNGTRTQITVAVVTTTGTGLMAPAPAPITHANAPIAAATPAPQPAAHSTGTGTGNSVQPQVADAPTTTPDAQPMRH